MATGLTKEDIKKAFEMIDKDDNGFIDKRELTDFYKEADPKETDDKIDKLAAVRLIYFIYLFISQTVVQLK